MQFDRPDGVSDAGPTPLDAESEIDILWILNVIKRRLWLIIILTLITSAIAIAVVKQLEPRYLSETRIFFEGDKLNIVQMEEVIVDRNFGLEDQVQLVRSQTLLEGVVRDLGLTKRPEFNPAIDPEAVDEPVEDVAEPIARPSLDDEISVETAVQWGEFALRWGEDAIEWVRSIIDGQDPAASDELDQTEISEIEKRRIVSAIRELQAGLSVGSVSARVLAIQYVSADPDLSAEVANAVAERFLLEQLSTKVEATRNATEWLTERTAELEERVR
ncbi:MAG: Wzz/FepE/Etk N-terminal domain-containing protein, partial [Pseudomonadota bacterium]